MKSIFSYCFLEAVSKLGYFCVVMKRYAYLYILYALLTAVSCGKAGADIPEDDMTPASYATVYGRVKTADGAAIDRVLVSDGTACTLTNSKGEYNLKSTKRSKLVYISTPSYYKVETINGVPQFYRNLTKPEQTPERHDFVLYPDPDQDRHVRFLLGDIHIYKDACVQPFMTFIDKLNSDAHSLSSSNFSAVTLGDMTWDWYWYANNYKIPKYLSLASRIKMPLYCTVGNHDHDMKIHHSFTSEEWFNSWDEINRTGEDWTVQNAYRETLGPTCHSMNIGSVHYISMDNVITTDDGTGTKDGRGCLLGFTRNDLEWLENDLSHTPVSMPVVLTVHMPFTYPSGSLHTAYGPNEDTGERISYAWFKGKGLSDMLAPFAGRKLYVVSAHTHVLYTNSASVVTPKGVVEFTEWNSAAVCGYFWSPALAGISICADGSPGGYRVIEFTGKDVTQNRYQAYEKKGFYPFRSYDRNTFAIDSRNSQSPVDFKSVSTANYVYFTVWDYDERWKIWVEENGLSLKVTEIGESYDPLVLYMNQEGAISADPVKTYHMFRVKASAPNTTLTISVTDPFGNTATEIMARPKYMNIDNYRTEEFNISSRE